MYQFGPHFAAKLLWQRMPNSTSYGAFYWSTQVKRILASDAQGMSVVFSSPIDNS